jgi:hypothetical protein
MKTFLLLAAITLYGCTSPAYYSKKEVYAACYAERHPDTPERMAYHIQWYPDVECRKRADEWSEQRERRFVGSAVPSAGPYQDGRRNQFDGDYRGSRDCFPAGDVLIVCK